MVSAEGTTDVNAAAAEVATYQRLMPSATSLKATFLVEILDPDVVKSELTRLMGLQNSIRLQIGGHACPASDIPPPDDIASDRTFSVHFLRFPLSPAAIEGLRGAEPAAVVIDHPEYSVSVPVSATLRAQFVADLVD